MDAKSITWVGMDAHKNSIKVATLLPEQPESVEWTEDGLRIKTDRRDARKLAELFRAGLLTESGVSFPMSSSVSAAFQYATPSVESSRMAAS